MKKKENLAFLLLLLVAVCFSGCARKHIESSDVENASDGKKLVIGFSIDSFVIERWRRDCDVFINTAKEHGASVIVQNAGNSVEEQIKQIKYLIDLGVDVLVIVPKNADSLSEVVQKATAKGIPVISYDRLIRNADISLYVSIDSRKVGTLMAEGLYAQKPLGSYFCIYGAGEDYNMQLICEGVHEVLSKTPVSIDVEYYTEGWNYDLSYQKMTQMLESGHVPDAVICGNDAVAESVLRALSEYQLGNAVAVSGQDADIAGCQRVVEGKQALTVYKPITQLARKAAEYACSLAEGKKAAELENISETISNGFAEIPVFWLAPQLVTAANIDDVVIKTGFHTHEEVYRHVEAASE